MYQGISFEEFKNQSISLPDLENFEIKCTTIEHPYLPKDQKFVLQMQTQVEKNQKNILIQTQLIYNTFINIPQFYFLLQDCESSHYVSLNEFIDDKEEEENFIRDINPINGIAMITMHNCLLPNFIQYASEKDTYLLALISYYFSKLHVYIKKTLK